jgi:hypothetical protein
MNGGLIVTGVTQATVHRDLIVVLARRHKLPAVYFERLFVVAGGLISFGADLVDQYRLAAGYVDRILRGDKPADLPVQAPTKYELANQPQDRQGARANRARQAARYRQRGHRIIAFCCIALTPLLCRFSAVGNDDLTTRYERRRPKSAKARNRVGR